MATAVRNAKEIALRMEPTVACRADPAYPTRGARVGSGGSARIGSTQLDLAVSVRDDVVVIFEQPTALSGELASLCASSDLLLT
jgi:hypothetical protein